jgi:hypothetical protein
MKNVKLEADALAVIVAGPVTVTALLMFTDPFASEQLPLTLTLPPLFTAVWRRLASLAVFVHLTEFVAPIAAREKIKNEAAETSELRPKRVENKISYSCCSSCRINEKVPDFIVT